MAYIMMNNQGWSYWGLTSFKIVVGPLHRNLAISLKYAPLFNLFLI
jgi:hypothetical protein